MTEQTYNWNITGHGRVIAGLEKDILQGNVSHAYLFAGPAGIGKFTAAKTMAHILQCENGYCRECPACREIERGCHADTIERVDNGESIRIEEVRDLISGLHLRPNSPRKICLLQNIERMTLESSNAMLKTLEDPPDSVVFLLTTSNLKGILTTIISRVRVINFQRLTAGQTEEFLRKYYPEAESGLLHQVTEFCMGRPGRAKELLDDPAVFDDVRKMYNDVAGLIGEPDRMAGFSYVERIVKRVKDDDDDKAAMDFFDIFTAVLRGKMLEDRTDAAARKKTIFLLKEVRRAQDLFGRNVNVRLLMENLMLSLC